MSVRIVFLSNADDENSSKLYLEHHGILGQKWGQRRWQNEDGSLTSAGYEHYGYGRDSKKSIRNASNKTADALLNDDTKTAKRIASSEARKLEAEKKAQQVNELTSAVKKHHEYTDDVDKREDEKAIKSFEKTITKNPQIKQARKEAVAYMKQIDKIFKQLDKARKVYESNKELTSKYGSWSNYIFNANTPESNKFKKQTMEAYGSRNTLRDKLETFLHTFTGEVGSQKLGDKHRVGDVTVDRYLAEFVIDKYIDR